MVHSDGRCCFVEFIIIQYCQKVTGTLNLTFIYLHYCLCVRQIHSQLSIRFNVVPSRWLLLCDTSYINDTSSFAAKQRHVILLQSGDSSLCCKILTLLVSFQHTSLFRGCEVAISKTGLNRNMTQLRCCLHWLTIYLLVVNWSSILLKISN